MNNKGASDAVKNMFIASIVIILVSYLMISFALNIGNSYSRNIDDSELNFTGMQLELETLNESTQSWREAFTEQNTVVSSFGLVFKGIFDLVNVIYKAILAPMRLLGYLLSNVLLIPNVVLDTLTLIIIVTLIFGTWRLLRAGD